MKFIFCRKLAFLTVLCSVDLGPALAHEFWLDPVTYSPRPGARVPVVQRTGINFLGDSFPYLRAPSKRFSVIDARGERPIKATEGDDPAAEVLFANAGLATVAYERKADLLVHPTFARMVEIVEVEGLDHVPAQHKALGFPDEAIREHYSRFAKTLIKVGDGKGRDRAVGLPFEIIVEGNPYELAKEAPIQVLVLHDGRPVQNVLVKAFNRADEKSPRTARTSAEGRASLEQVPSGEVLLNAVIMMPAARDSGAEWSSLWASVTFKRP